METGATSFNYPNGHLMENQPFFEQLSALTNKKVEKQKEAIEKQTKFLKECKMFTDVGFNTKQYTRNYQGDLFLGFPQHPISNFPISNKVLEKEVTFPKTSMESQARFILMKHLQKLATGLTNEPVNVIKILEGSGEPLAMTDDGVTTVYFTEKWIINKLLNR